MGLFERINEKCERFQLLLQPIKHAINGAKFEFNGQIYNNNNLFTDTDFTDNSMLLAYLEEELLPICNACSSYKFEIYFLSDYSSATNVITTILQFGPIDGCSEVLINLSSTQFFQIEMPIMSIANWLNHSRSSDTINNNGQVKKERILVIDSRAAYITNLLALVNGLKKVNF